MKYNVIFGIISFNDGKPVSIENEMCEVDEIDAIVSFSDKLEADTYGNDIIDRGVYDSYVIHEMYSGTVIFNCTDKKSLSLMEKFGYNNKQNQI